MGSQRVSNVFQQARRAAEAQEDSHDVIGLICCNEFPHEHCGLAFPDIYIYIYIYVYMYIYMLVTHIHILATH